jgi:hypothetical protein
MAQISHEDDDDTAWVCPCGNTPANSGYTTCNADGEEIEPTIGGHWTSLYVCNSCGRIIDQENLAVVGRRRAASAEQS